jgi:hypothetical protein
MTLAKHQNYQKLGPEECWPWLGCLCELGYGVIRDGKNRKIKAHRVAYEDQIGPIPSGLNVLHHCDNRRCCNGAHLFIGTQQDNIRDMVAKGRQVTWVTHPQAKFNAEQVRQIRIDLRPVREIARYYGVHHESIRRIKKQTRYRNVT